MLPLVPVSGSKPLILERLMLAELLKCPLPSEIEDFVSNEADEYGQLNLTAEISELPNVSKN